MNTQRFQLRAFIPILLLLASAYSPIAYSVVAEEKAPRISLVSTDRMEGCPEFILTSPSTIRAVHPTSTPICIDVEYAPDEPKLVQINLFIENNTGDIISSFPIQEYSFANQDDFRNQIFTFPYIPPDDAPVGEYQIHLEMYERNFLKQEDEIELRWEGHLGNINIGLSESSATISSLTGMISQAPQGGQTTIDTVVMNTGSQGARYLLSTSFNGTEIGRSSYALPAGQQGVTTIPITLDNYTPLGLQTFTLQIFNPASPDIPLNSSQFTIDVIEPYQTIHTTEFNIQSMETQGQSATAPAGSELPLTIRIENPGSLTAIGIPTFTLTANGSMEPTILPRLVDNSSVELEAGMENELIERIFIPTDTPTGPATLRVDWIGENLSTPTGLDTSFNITPVQHKASITIGDRGLNGQHNISVQNLGTNEGNFELSWELSNAIHSDEIYEGNQPIGILAPNESREFSINPLDGVCSIGRWTIDLAVHETGSSNAIAKEHQFALLNSTAPDVKLQFKSGTPVRDSVVSGEQLTLVIDFTSSEHACGSILLPYRIHFIGQDDSLAVERSVLMNSLQEFRHVESIDIPSNLRTGDYEIFIETFKSIDDNFIQHDNEPIGTISITGGEPSATIDSCHIPDLEIRTNPIIRCDITNQGALPEYFRLTSERESLSENSPVVKVLSGDSRELQVNSPLSQYGENIWNITLEALHNGIWHPIAFENFTQTLENPYAGIDPLGNISIIPYPPTAGQLVTIMVDSTGTQPDMSGVVRINMEDTRGFAELMEKPRTWELGEIHVDGVQIRWPSDCREYSFEVTIEHNDGNVLDKKTSDNAKGCNDQLPDLSFFTVEDMGDHIILGVENSGLLKSIDTSATILLDGIEWRSIPIPSLNPGDIVWLNQSGVPTHSGIQVVLDDGDYNNEQSEGFDNTFSTGSEYSSDEDKDGDGLSDLQEIQGWDVHIINSRGQYDCFFEEMEGDNPDVMQCIEHVGHFSTSTTSHDTDGDGLSDLYEYEHRLDPTSADTDGDGVIDSVELSTEGMDPHVVELDPPTIEALPAEGAGTSNEGQARWNPLDLFFYTHYVRIFEVTDQHISADSVVLVEVYSDGEVTQTIIPELVSLSDGYATYSVTLRTDFSEEYSGFEVRAVAYDDYGNSESLDIASKDSLSKRALTSFVGFVNDILPGGAAAAVFGGVASVHGFAMGLYTSLKDMAQLIGMIPGLLWTFTKFIWNGLVCLIDTIFGDCASIPPVIEQLGELMDSLVSWLRDLSLDFEALLHNGLDNIESAAKSVGNGIKKLGGGAINLIKKAYKEGKESSIYSKIADVYDIFLLGFIAGFIAFEIGFNAVTAGAASGAKLIKAGANGGDAMRGFFGGMMDAMPCVVKKTAGRTAAAKVCKGHFDELTGMANKIKKINPFSGPGRRIAAAESDLIAELWTRAIRADKAGPGSAEHTAFLKWLDEDAAKILKNTKKGDQPVYLAHLDFVKHHMNDLPPNKRMTGHNLKRWGQELNTGPYDDAILANSEQFRLLMKDPKMNGDLGNIKGMRGELRSVEPNCRTMDSFPGGGEIDKLCIAGGKVTHKEVKTSDIPSKAAADSAKKGQQNRAKQLDNHLQSKIDDAKAAGKSDAEALQDARDEYVRLACGGKSRVDCDMDTGVMDDEFDAFRDAMGSGDPSRTEFHHEFVSTGKTSPLVKDCIANNWAGTQCQSLLNTYPPATREMMEKARLSPAAPVEDDWDILNQFWSTLSDDIEPVPPTVIQPHQWLTAPPTNGKPIAILIASVALLFGIALINGRKPPKSDLIVIPNQ